MNLTVTPKLTAEEQAEAAALEPAEEECRVGKCSFCGDICNDLLPAEGGLRCAECDSEYEYCGICKEEQHCDDHCRHIFTSQWGGLLGSGTYMSDNDLDYVRKVLVDLLDLMPQGFAQSLRVAIASGRFFTWATMPIIGGGGMLELNGMPNRHGRYAVSWWGDFLMEIGQGDDAEEAADAYLWLASLYKNATVKANNITMRWLDQYIALERAARIWAIAA